MKTAVCFKHFIAGVAFLSAFTGLVRAQVVTTDPSLPVVYPDGVYRTPTDVHAEYHGPGLDIVLSNILHAAFALPPIVRTNVGPDEIEEFASGMGGLISVNGSPFLPASGMGQVRTIVSNKTGNTTGTFETEMLSMELTGNSGFGPFQIRESPTLRSLGRTTITDIGGGLYQIDSFFDVFTELSIDGGNTWIPSSGSTHVMLVPEPSSLILVALSPGLLTLVHRARRLGKRG